MYSFNDSLPVACPDQNVAVARWEEQRGATLWPWRRAFKNLPSTPTSPTHFALKKRRFASKSTIGSCIYVCRGIFREPTKPEMYRGRSSQISANPVRHLALNGLKSAFVDKHDVPNLSRRNRRFFFSPVKKLRLVFPSYGHGSPSVSNTFL